MTCTIVIPARWGSTRLPGKPLATVAGTTLLERAITLAKRAVDRISQVDIVVATDDSRIEEAAAAMGCAVSRTDPGLTSGSSRALAAAEQRDPPPRTVVNLQCDAPFMPAIAVTRIVEALAAGAPVVTPVIRLGWPALDALRRHKRRTPFSGTTCIVAEDGAALWFSKSIIPAIRDEHALRQTARWSPVFRHLGLYGFALDALRRFDAAPVGRYERLEGLEQLRLIEMGLPIQTIAVEPDAAAGFLDIGGIDTAADIELAERVIATYGDPHDR